MRRLAISLLLLFFLPHSTQAQQCFPQTVFCLEFPFDQYWQQHGGLAIFGYPIVRDANEPNPADGKTYRMQWLERNRLEYHPDQAGTPYEVQLGLLGKERLAQLGRQPDQPGPIQGDCRYFNQTGLNICNDFLGYWQGHGLNIAGLSADQRSLALFGLPLTSAKLETNAAGDTVLTQWFERARFELHPNNPEPYRVLLGLLGRETLDGYGIAPGQPVVPQPTNQPTSGPQPTAPPAATATLRPTATPTLPPPSFNNCQSDNTAAPNWPVRISGLNKSTEVVTIQNLSNASVNIQGWRICSIRGNQLHAMLSGSLAAGESRPINSQANGPIWSDSDKDDAALYDGQGRLVAYFED